MQSCSYYRADAKSEKCKLAIEEEITSLIKNQTSVLVPRPRDQSVIGCKWLFKRKQELENPKKV